MRTFVVLPCCLLQLLFIGTNSFIIPDELPSLLSVIYSNIPTLKKGTDSRMGWGFRLGDRADFQVLVELGPQQYTQPLGNQGDNANSKRNTIDTLADTLYAQRQEEKRQKQEKEKEKKLETQGAKWLDQWSKTAEQPAVTTVDGNAKPGLAEGEIDAKSVIPADDDAVIKLLRLYKQLRKEQEARKRAETLVKKLKEQKEATTTEFATTVIAETSTEK